MPKIIKEIPNIVKTWATGALVPYLWNIKSFDHFEKLEISYSNMDFP